MSVSELLHVRDNVNIINNKEKVTEAENKPYGKCQLQYVIIYVRQEKGEEDDDDGNCQSFVMRVHDKHTGLSTKRIITDLKPFLVPSAGPGAS